MVGKDSTLCPSSISSGCTTLISILPCAFLTVSFSNCFLHLGLIVYKVNFLPINIGSFISNKTLIIIQFNPLEIHTLEMKLSIMLCKKFLEQGCSLLQSLALRRMRVQPLHICLSTLAKAQCLLDPLSQSGTADNISLASCFLMRRRLPTHTFLKPPYFSVIVLSPFQMMIACWISSFSKFPSAS